MNALLLAAACCVPWKLEHKVLLGLSQTMVVADWFTAIDGARQGRQELNYFLGRQPSVGSINTYNVVVLAANMAVAATLPSDWRTAYLVAVAAFEAAVVLHQFRIGLHLSLRL